MFSKDFTFYLDFFYDEGYSVLQNVNTFLFWVFWR